MHTPDFESWTAEQWQDGINHAYQVARLEEIKVAYPAIVVDDEDDLSQEEIAVAKLIWQEGLARGYQPAPEIRARIEAVMEEYCRALDQGQAAYRRWILAGKPSQ